jgi:hypothetical protein
MSMVTFRLYSYIRASLLCMETLLEIISQLSTVQFVNMSSLSAVSHNIYVHSLCQQITQFSTNNKYISIILIFKITKPGKISEMMGIHKLEPG